MFTWSVLIIILSYSTQCWTHGSLYTDAGKSEKTCKPLKSFSVDIKCNRNGLEVDCTKPVLNGTTAEISCKPFFHFPPYDNIPSFYNRLACVDGLWDYNLLPCIPICGKKNEKSKRVRRIIGGGNTGIGEYPWHVGIYSKRTIRKKTVYSQICGGSIINPKVVITVAHCFESKDPKNYGVGAGKYYRPWKDNRDENAQLRNVEQIFIPESYKGLSNNFANDVAILVVNDPFVFDNFVRPVCVDWTTNTKKDLLKMGSIGFVPGWGVDQEGGKKSAVLKDIQLPFVPYDECYSKSDQNFRPIVNLADKFCAGRTDGQNICKGDSGGGLAFQGHDVHHSGEIFYLMGISSIGPSKTGSCDPTKYTTFTKLSHHAKWAQNIIKIHTSAYKDFNGWSLDS
ncbi:clotting factor C-like [Chrysoperla carnea]|uniref:clotting factor C-like n=1 Tax=Chrysoperla carnea TaxID=189513 RepID=UPI001D095DAB|nr:clotting factor C-like [Chrysoperla carnea]